jgi:fused signal recognition particle receptor
MDTAGRLHTQKHLMDELSKIRKVITKIIPDAPHEVILVVDGTTGQNAIVQAKMFTAAINVTGIFLAKLDMLDIPVKFVGLGETPEDIAEFDPEEFVEALFN